MRQRGGRLFRTVAVRPAVPPEFGHDASMKRPVARRWDRDGLTHALAVEARDVEVVEGCWRP